MQKAEIKSHSTHKMQRKQLGLDLGMTKNGLKCFNGVGPVPGTEGSNPCD